MWQRHQMGKSEYLPFSGPGCLECQPAPGRTRDSSLSPPSPTQPLSSGSCTTVQCNELLCNALQCTTVQCDAMRCTVMMQLSRMQCNQVLYNTLACRLQTHVMKCRLITNGNILQEIAVKYVNMFNEH